MSETRTFKNPFVSDGGKGITLYSRISTGTPISTLALETFMHDEWDFEITFTPKHRPIAVGDKVVNTYGATIGTVLALHDEGRDDKSWAWVRWGYGQAPGVSNLKLLRHAGS